MWLIGYLKKRGFFLAGLYRGVFGGGCVAPACTGQRVRCPKGSVLWASAAWKLGSCSDAEHPKGRLGRCTGSFQGCSCSLFGALCQWGWFWVPVTSLLAGEEVAGAAVVAPVVTRQFHYSWGLEEL